MIDFKEIAKEIFGICTNISKSDGRATEKIERILRAVYQKGKEDSCIHENVCNNLSYLMSDEEVKELFDTIVMEKIK